MLGGFQFDKEDLLVDWSLYGCKIGVLPRSFNALVCTGGIFLSCNRLGFLLADFSQLKVGGDLHLNRNQLGYLPADFGQLKVSTFG